MKAKGGEIYGRATMFNFCCYFNCIFNYHYSAGKLYRLFRDFQYFSILNLSTLAELGST